VAPTIAEGALAVLKEWQSRREAAEATLADADLFVRAVFGAGVRHWLGEAFGCLSLIRGASDLRAWCDLQIRVLRAARPVFPVPLVSNRGGDALQDGELLTGAAPLFNRPTEVGEGLLSWVRGLSVLCADEENWDEYYFMVGKEMLDVTPPRPLGKDDFAGLIRRAWSFLDSVAQQMIPVPPMPAAETYEACEEALACVASWCLGREAPAATSSAVPEELGQARPDGPDPPFNFWFRGKRYSGLRGRELELLDLLWSRREYEDQWTVQLQLLSQDIYGNSFSQPGVLSTMKRLRQRLTEQDFPGDLVQEKGFLSMHVRL
jgi:hypothetical protein